MILAIETATQVCSVAFMSANEGIEERRTEKYGQHSEKLFEFVESLKETCGFDIEDLEACLVSEGPGSYTGLRIGASGVKGLLFGSDIPLFAINTLAAIGWGVRVDMPVSSVVHATVDARRRHLYHQKYELTENGISPLCKADIRLIEDIHDMISPGEGVAGTGWSRLDKSIRSSVYRFGIEKISACNLIGLFENELGDKMSFKNVTEQRREILHKIDPGRFDPNYITTKKPGT